MVVLSEDNGRHLMTDHEPTDPTDERPRKPRRRPVRLVLVRHGQTHANREMRYVGSRDDALNEMGHRQAEELAPTLVPFGAKALFASPLRRAQQTAAPFSRLLELPVTVEERLAEQCFGEWEGLTRAEVLARGEDDADLHRRWADDPSVAPPGGESSDQVAERMADLADELAGRHGGEVVVLVGHVGSIKGLLGAALGNPAAGRRMFLDSATVTVVDWARRPGRSVVRLFNAPAPGRPWSPFHSTS
jgi:probable phosphoglycerate mutase